MSQHNRSSDRTGFWRSLLPKRLPGRKIYRAFPELDPFSDAQCRAFLKRASASWLRWLARWAVCLIASAVVAGATWIPIFQRIEDQNRAGGWKEDQGVELLFAAAVIGAVTLPLFTGIFLRDLLLRRRIGHLIASSGSCVQCGYAILGLAPDSNLRVRCPECGHVNVVDPAVVTLLSGVGYDQPWPLRAISVRRERMLVKTAFWIGSPVAGLLLVVLSAWLLAGADYYAGRDLQRSQRASTLAIADARNRSGFRGERAGLVLDRAALRFEALSDPVLRQACDPRGGWGSIPASEHLPTLMQLLVKEPNVSSYLMGSPLTDADVSKLANNLASLLGESGFLEILDRVACGMVNPDADGGDGRETIFAPDDLRINPTRLRLDFLFDAATLITRRAQLLGDGDLALRSLGSRADLERLTAAEPGQWTGNRMPRQRALLNDLAYFASVARTAEDLDDLEVLLNRYELEAEPRLAVEIGVCALIDGCLQGRPPTFYNGSLVDWLNAVKKTTSIYGENYDVAWMRKEAEIWRKRSLKWVDQHQAARRDQIAAPPPPSPPAFMDVGVKLALERTEMLSPVRVCVAIRRFSLRNGRDPGSLEELIPSDLPALPPLIQPDLSYLYRRIDPCSDPYGRSFLLSLLQPEDIAPRSLIAPPPSPGSPAALLNWWMTYAVGPGELNHPSTQPRVVDFKPPADLTGGISSLMPSDPDQILGPDRSRGPAQGNGPR